MARRVKSAITSADQRFASTLPASVADDEWRIDRDESRCQTVAVNVREYLLIARNRRRVEHARSVAVSNEGGDTRLMVCPFPSKTDTNKRRFAHGILDGSKLMRSSRRRPQHRHRKRPPLVPV